MKELKNLIICGASRSGKTNAIKNEIYETLQNGGLVFVTDFKLLSYRIFKDKLSFLGTNEEDFYSMIRNVKTYFNNRLELLINSNCEKWQEYITLKGEKLMKEILVVIDEYSLITNLKKANKALYELLNVCSCCRIRIIIGVQRADNDIITTKIRTNCEIMSFEVKNENDKKLIGIPKDYEFLKYMALNVNTMKEKKYRYLENEYIRRTIC